VPFCGESFLQFSGLKFPLSRLPPLPVAGILKFNIK